MVGGAGRPPASAAARAAHFKLKATCVPVMAAYDVTDAGNRGLGHAVVQPCG